LARYPVSAGKHAWAPSHHGNEWANKLDRGLLLIATSAADDAMVHHEYLVAVAEVQEEPSVPNLDIAARGEPVHLIHLHRSKISLISSIPKRKDRFKAFHWSARAGSQEARTPLPAAPGTFGSRH
jgi:hypothetical protein